MFANVFIVTHEQLLRIVSFWSLRGPVPKGSTCKLIVTYYSSGTAKRKISVVKQTLPMSRKLEPSRTICPTPNSPHQRLPLNDGGRERCALSVGQFRPEKDHALQVRALAALRNLSHTPKQNAYGVVSGVYPSFDDVRLVILGSCRNNDDRAVLAKTKALAVELGLEESVLFVVNCSFAELKAWLGRASVGLHTMWNEHFGIGVVEMMVRGK